MHRQHQPRNVRSVRRTVSAGGVVVRRDRRGTFILLTKHTKLPKWQLPKGHVEKGESIEHAALREVGEETGLRHARIIRKLATVHRKYVNRLGELKTVHYFLMEPLEPIRERPSDQKHFEVRWFPAREASRKLLLSEQRSLLERHRSTLGF